MAIGQYQVHQAVVVVVEKLQPPAAEQASIRRQTVLVRGIEKGFVLVVSVERKYLVVDIGYEEVLIAIAVDVGRIHTHAGTRPAAFAVGHFGHERNLLPLVVSPIHKKKVLHGIVGNEQIHSPIVVDVGGHYAQAFPHGALDGGAAGHIGERSVAIVVKQEAMGGLKQSRNAVIALSGFVDAARRFVRVVDEAAHEQIQAAVVI